MIDFFLSSWEALPESVQYLTVTLLKIVLVTVGVGVSVGVGCSVSVGVTVGVSVGSGVELGPSVAWSGAASISASICSCPNDAGRSGC